MPKRRALINGALLTLVFALAGCSTPSPTVGSQSTKPAFSIYGATVCAPTPASPSTAQPHAWFLQAKKEWLLGTESDSAAEGECWERSALDLYGATEVAATQPHGFYAAANELDQLSALPDNMLTPAQLTLANKLFRQLDEFFGTKGAYGVSATSPTTTTTTTTTAPLLPGQLPIAVESDGQMRVEGNDGPSSSVLVPTSCQLSGSTVTAKGTFQGYDEAYDRYGDIVVLYVFGPSSSGYPDGPQIGVSSVTDSPPVGVGTWQVSATVEPGVSAAKCVVAAQPTHDEQLAP